MEKGGDDPGVQAKRVIMETSRPHLACPLCGRRTHPVSYALGVCAKCVRGGGAAIEDRIKEAHEKARCAYGLPAVPPRAKGGVPCHMCGNACFLREGERGYCGLRVARGGRLKHLAGTARGGVVEYYHDPLPTNCVADWVCAGSWERGKTNLAVFLGACTFDCLFCQNAQYHMLTACLTPIRRPGELAEAADDVTACICWFGGDPSAQMPFALRASEEALARRRGKVRICWETNGSMHPSYLRRAMDLSIASGGCVKFDLKAFDPRLHLALCGVSNRRTLENFAYAALRARERPNPPPLVASTLMVPGYVEAEEVERIASFISDLDRDIPYSLLAFHPQHAMRDLPITARRQAEECCEAARSAGLTRVHIGNLHLL